MEKHSYTMRERCITPLYHVIENTVANTINITKTRLDIIPSYVRLLPAF